MNLLRPPTSAAGLRPCIESGPWAVNDHGSRVGEIARLNSGQRQSVVAEGGEAGRPPARPRRRLVDGIRFRVRTGVPWRDVPVEYGLRGRVYDLFRRWQRDGTWHRILTRLQALTDAPPSRPTPPGRGPPRSDRRVPDDVQAARAPQRGPRTARTRGTTGGRPEHTSPSERRRTEADKAEEDVPASVIKWRSGEIS
ncbi:transposase [Streptomyces sp. NBC_00233]|uniref:transposase n=1 Tax=Streptomyces sp. NBC_00233 TaxID=2975686 RepID=UPI002258D23F|nr:transposase [Streptomyces sp. NBC_00233]MCX5231507.1 transposase [Streptomyces sp. NBC_00233]